MALQDASLSVWRCFHVAIALQVMAGEGLVK
jgi:hypothetical protein